MQTTTNTETAKMNSHDGHTMEYTPATETARFDCTCGFSTEDGFWGHYHMRDGRTPTN